MKQAERKEFRYHGISCREELVPLLTQIVKGLEEGSITLSEDGRKLKLTPNEPINVEVDAKSTSHYQELTLIMRWNLPLPETRKLDLSIDTGKP